MEKRNKFSPETCRYHIQNAIYLVQDQGYACTTVSICFCVGSSRVL